MLHLNSYLQANSLLIDEQFGFRTGRSTADQFILSYNDISLSLDQGKFVDLIILDYSKAFKVLCSILLTNLLFSYKSQNSGEGGFIHE